MITVFILGIVGGMDNFQIASALGLLGLKPNRRWMLVVALIFFDVVMGLTGLMIGNKLNLIFENIAESLGPGVLMAMGFYIIIREFRENEKKDFVNNKWFLIFLPLLMSLDNLLTGLGLGTAGYPVVTSSIIMGVCSGIMCLLGLVTGRKLRSLIPGKLEIISGIYLIGLGVFLFIKK